VSDLSVFAEVVRFPLTRWAREKRGTGNLLKLPLVKGDLGNGLCVVAIYEFDMTLRACAYCISDLPTAPPLFEGRLEICPRSDDNKNESLLKILTS